MSNIPVIIVLCSLLFLASCGDDQAVSVALGEIPDTVSQNFRQVTISPTGRLEINAGQVEHFNNQDITQFQHANIVEFNASKEKTLEGNANQIELTGNRNGFAEGNIFLKDFSSDMQLEAEYLEWDNSQKLLTGKGIVTISSKDGTRITGKGFVADAARERYSFSKGVTGILEISDEN